MNILHHHHQILLPLPLSASFIPSNSKILISDVTRRRTRNLRPLKWRKMASPISAALRPLDLTEENVTLVLADARTEASPFFAQIFDTSVGMTGEAKLSEVDGPFVKISLRGRFWHERSMVLARLGNYLKQRIPHHCASLSQEILEVDIEDEKQLDDSPENF
ncbi:hypothetical protein HHK36_003509 [Tetracentron sinense]|uniref:Uncharacterized protein n=1 Tax=Tetracentron sinense TaxID=13715 RepID=A0A835DPD9_TETSI|nr:hypothetical protein HHK36_003509 [Tetracentron sinense]